MKRQLYPGDLALQKSINTAKKPLRGRYTYIIILEATSCVLTHARLKRKV